MIQNIKLKVVGVSFSNPNGTNRQDIISRLNKDSAIFLQREPHNQYDINAIAVHTMEGQIGYIGKDYAQVLAGMMDGGTILKAEIAEVGTYKNTWYAHIIINEVV